MSEELKRVAFSMDENKLAQLKVQTRQKRLERERQDDLRQQEEQRRISALREVFSKWVLPGEKGVPLAQVGEAAEISFFTSLCDALVVGPSGAASREVVAGGDARTCNGQHLERFVNHTIHSYSGIWCLFYFFFQSTNTLYWYFILSTMYVVAWTHNHFVYLYACRLVLGAASS